MQVLGMEHVHEGVGLSSVWKALSAKVYLDDEKFVTKMTAIAEQSLKGTRAGRSRLEIPNAQPNPVPLATCVKQNPNNPNAVIQAAFCYWSLLHVATCRTLQAAIHKYQQNCEVDLKPASKISY